MDFASYFPIWNELSDRLRQDLLAAATEKKAAKGAIIHGGSLNCTGLLLVKSGQLRAYTLSENGRELTLYRLFERDMCLFSAACVMNSIQFDISIEAEKETEFWQIDAGVYKRLMNESAKIANYTNELMASRFSDVMWLMDQVLWKSFDKRLAAFLLEESAIEQSPVLNLTHEAIGNHLGNPREVVTRMLRYFQNEGMVKLSRGSLEIIDPDRLLAIAE
jgi:CRP/FNR family transcriptional regulator